MLAHPPARRTRSTVTGSEVRRAAVLGANLIVIRSAIGVGTVWLLPVPAGTRLEAALNFAVTAAVAVATLLLPWARLPRVALIMYPAIGVTGLALLGAFTTGVGEVYTGFLVFVFIYAGSTGSIRGVLALMVPCAVASALLDGVTHTGFTAATAIRELIAVLVWITLGLLLARRSEDEHRHCSALTDAARTDPLTGLENRRGLDELLAVTLPGDTVIAVDIDEFRMINSVRGHTGGDTVLAEFGRIVRVELRDGDRAIRLGGDEFVLILAAVGEVHAVPVLSRIREQWQECCGRVTFSAGVAITQLGETGQNALRRADQHCYTAKDAGRDRWILDELQPARVG